MFTTLNNIRFLAESDTLFSDGTFKTVPNQFLQLFTIHGIVRQFVFPFVFCLTAKKNEHTYNTIYNELKNYAVNNHLTLSPRYAVSDFEIANMNACRAAFPEVTLTGCLYHYTQSIWRQVVSKGLRELYLDIQQPTIRQQIQQIMALPFIPLQDVQEVWELLYDNMQEEIIELASYVETTCYRTPCKGKKTGSSIKIRP